MTAKIAVATDITAGGAAPSTSCDAANAKQVERVGYTAMYVFWRLKAS